MPLLARMLDLLFPPRDTEALVRELDLAALGALVAPDVGLVDGCAAYTLLPYRHPAIRSLIIEAKFKNNPHAQTLLAHVLGDFLVEFLHERGQFLTTNFVLVPIPLGPERLRERGYNQTERLAALAVGQNRLSLPVEGAHLVRTRETLPQTDLPRGKRLENMKGAFAASGVDAHHTYIVFDDVLTTGSTLAAAIDALRQAGATTIVALALAK